MSEFNFESFLRKEKNESFPEGISTKAQIKYYKAILELSNKIEERILSDGVLLLTKLQRKVYPAAVTRHIGKSRSNIRKDRSQIFSDIIESENKRLNLLYIERCRQIQRNSPKDLSHDIEGRLKQLEKENTDLREKLDMKVIDLLIDERKNYRYVDLKNTIDALRKEILALEEQNRELRYRLMQIIK